MIDKAKAYLTVVWFNILTAVCWFVGNLKAFFKGEEIVEEPENPRHITPEEAVENAKEALAEKED